MVPDVSDYHSLLSHAVRKIIRLYANAFSNLSGASWMLALIMFINRSGSMVIPFLSVYLTDDLDMTVTDAGTIMAVFGLGSMGGSLLGGWLTDRIGQFKVQFSSLFFGGLIFFLLANVKDFYQLAVGVFVLSLVTDSLRPANSASIAMYARPENVTRAFSLNRMAVNLGFSVGPALGGLLAAISFSWLFIADGLTCIFASFLFYFYFRNRKTYGRQRPEVNKPMVTGKSAWKDKRFIAFSFFCACFAFSFFQLFSTLPLYYREVFDLSERSIGLLIGLNGLVVFSLEMVTVYVIGKRWSIRRLIIYGNILIAISFVLLNVAGGKPLLYVSMIVLSIAEILAMPYMVTYTVERSGEYTRGSYMGMYSLAYASAFVVAPYAGTRIIDNFGYDVLWWWTATLGIFTAIGFYFIIGKSPAAVAEEPPPVH